MKVWLRELSLKRKENKMKSFSKKANTNPDVLVKPSKPFVPTGEQVQGKDLVMKEPVVKFLAAAGSGKSSSLYYFGRENNVPSLGLVFNKSMALEAQAKSPRNIEWKTTHSLAFSKFGQRLVDKLSRPRGRYVNVAGTGSEIASYYGIRDEYIGEDDDYISKNFVGLIVKETVNSYEVSADNLLTKDNVPYHHIKGLRERYGKQFKHKRFMKMITELANSLWDERTDRRSDVLAMHNTYLKLYQLSKPDLSQYKVIYVDESQDLNPATIDIVMQQKGKCKLVWIGDKFQSIYQFNGSVNAMESLDCPEASLTKSFRFGEKIAQVARTVLRDKLKIVGNELMASEVSYEPEVIDTTKPYTILFRTNMELIFQAVKLITGGESVNVNTDLKDFVAIVKSADALYREDMRKVKHEDILPFTKWEDLVEEGKADAGLRRVAKIVENDQADEIITTLHSHKNEGSAHITLTSAHKSKGLEFNQVILASDFPSNYDSKGQYVGLSDQERNLLYVACTRAEMALQYNSTVKELMELDNVDVDEKKFTNAVIKELNTVDGVQFINMQTEGGAEQAGYELQEVAEFEAQRDLYANGQMNEEEAFERGIIDHNGTTTESTESLSDRIKIQTNTCLRKEINQLTDML